MDVPLLSLENEVVYASDINQISKTKDKSGNYVYQDKSGKKTYTKIHSRILTPTLPYLLQVNILSISRRSLHFKY